MNALGVHLILELKDCKNHELLNDVEKIDTVMVRAAKEAGATVLSSNFHAFNPYGVSGVVIIAESHLTIHTWPEYNYAAIDIFTCGDVIDPKIAAFFLIKEYQSENPVFQELKRGILVAASEGKLPYKPAPKGINNEDCNLQTVC